MRKTAIALTALVFATACGGGGHHRTTAAGASTTLPVAAPSSDEVTAASTSPTSAGSANARTSTTSRSGGPGPTGTAKGGSSGPAPIAAGTYTYSQKGSATFGAQQYPVPATGTLVADPAKPDGTQVTHRVVDQSQGSVDTTLSFTGGGMFILAVTLHLGQTPVTCTFGAPLPAPPWPPAAGKTFSGNATCDFNGETAAVAGSVGPSSTYAVPKLGSRTVWAVDATITAQGPYQAKWESHQLFSPDLRIPVLTTDHITGTFGVVQFSADDQTQLVSGPA